MTLPIGAELTVHGEPALYSGPGRTGAIRLVNNTTAVVTIPATTTVPTADDSPLALLLPAGTLSDTCLREVQAIEGWHSRVGTSGSTDNPWDAVYLAPHAAVTLAPGAAHTILLHGLAADTGGRARHARAVLDHRFDSPAGPVVGSRSLVLYVVPWQHTPAHLHMAAGVLRGGEVLNRGAEPNEIVIRLTADSHLGQVELIGGRTELQLSWDVGPSEEAWWALCTPAEANATWVDVEWPVGSDPAPAGVPEPLDTEVWVSATAATWGIVVPANVTLRHGDDITITVKNLFCQHPSGPANLYLEVVGVGEGVSGSFVLPVQKQPQSWRDGGGLTMVARDTRLLDVRNTFGRPSVQIDREGEPEAAHGYALKLFMYDPARPDVDFVGAELSSFGQSFVGQGLGIGGPLTIGSAIEVGDSGDQLTIGRTAMAASGPETALPGRLRLGAPDDEHDFRTSITAGTLTAHGPVTMAAALTAEHELTVKGLLTASGDATVGGDVRGANFRHRDSLSRDQAALTLLAGGVRLSGLVNIDGDLRVKGDPAIRFETYDVTASGETQLGVDRKIWRAFLPGAAVLVAHYRMLTTVPIPIHLMNEEGGLALMVDRNATFWVDGLFLTVKDVPPGLLTGTARVTVLLVRHELFAR